MKGNLSYRKTVQEDQPEMELLLRTSTSNSNKAKTEAKNFTDVNRTGLLNTNWSVVMLCGELIGATTLSLPKALHHTGFFLGILIYIGMFIVSYYFALYLSATFAKVRGKIKEILNLGHMRDPYPQLVKYVIGKYAGYLTGVLIVLSDFLGSAVLILMPASMLAGAFKIMLAPHFSLDFNKRLWVFITALIVAPLTWNDRLKDNTSIGIIALVCATSAHFILILLYLMSFWTLHNFTDDSITNKWNNGFVSVGIMMTTIDGFDVLPTLQEDMAEQTQYKSVLQRSYLILFFLTAPAMIIGYILFDQYKIGENILEDIYIIIQSKSETGLYERFHLFLAYTAMAFFCVQIISSMILQLNPTFQLVESVISCNEGFSLKRCILRTLIISIILIFVEFAPALLPLMSTHGTILFVFLGIVLPGVMYLKTFEMTPTAKKLLITIIILMFGFFMFYNIYISVKMVIQQVKDHPFS